MRGGFSSISPPTVLVAGLVAASSSSRRLRVARSGRSIRWRRWTPVLELVGALGQLPPRQRAVLVLRYFHDLTEAQAAELLGCSPGTVKSSASRGLARLREVLELSSPQTPGVLRHERPYLNATQEHEL